MSYLPLHALTVDKLQRGYNVLKHNGCLLAGICRCTKIYINTLTVEHYQLSDTNTRTLSNERLETECKLHRSITSDHGRDVTVDR